ncbi:MAG: FISUMP domain-containing protein [Lentimicrobium sp.]|jgi:uncharacterized protein (TIGR02145 family)|nr:FISUMP domain-containing protein [Lentimicrobium sp.]
MRKTNLILLLCLLFGTVMAQAPKSFKYQAVARHNDGTVIANASIGIKIEIKAGGNTGNAVYTETFTALSNGSGVFTVNIGEGNSVSGDFSNINWGEGIYFLAVAMDASGGNSYTPMGATQLCSVPYALYTNSIYVKYSNDTLYIGDQYVVIPGGIGPPTGTVTDFDGNVYETIVIGTQTWMKENLRTLHYNNGDPIDGVYAFDDNEANVAGYGRLYTWNAIMGVSKHSSGVSGDICPAGWHIPSAAECEILEDYLDGNMVAGGKMKETGFIYWLSPNEGATNESGFSARGSGARGTSGNYVNLQEAFFMWTSTENSDTKAVNCALFYDSDNSAMNQVHPKSLGYSVRCLKD